MGQLFSRVLVNMFSYMFKKIRAVQFARTKMVFLVRTDLQMGKGKIASQVAHASKLLYKKSIINRNPYLNMWLASGQPKIVLKVETHCEDEMTNVFRNAMNSNLTACRVHDSGKTQIQPGNVTVVAIGPNKAEDIDKITSQFKLL